MVSEAVGGTYGHGFGEDLAVPLLPKPVLGTKVWSWAGTYATPAIAACVCVAVGTLHPLASEAAKSAHAFTCRGAGDCERVRIMPFHPVTLTICSEAMSIAVALLVMAGWEGSLSASERSRLRPLDVFRLWPLGAVYGLGDLMQAFAANSASAPVVIIMSQCKLLMTAVMSMWLLRSRTPAQWGHLVIITCAAISGAHNGAAKAESDAVRQGEVWGACLVMLKGLLSAFGAVFSEKCFKEEGDSFWAMSFKVQSMMLFTSLLTLIVWFWALGQGEAPRSFWPSDFLLSGPFPVCDVSPSGAPFCDPQGRGVCRCLDHVGWDHLTVLAMAAIVANGLATGLTLKHLSAVGKAVCNALSAAIVYPAYVGLGFRPFDLTQAGIISIIIVSSYMYTVEKTKQGAHAHRESLPLVSRRRRVASSGCGGG